MTTNNGKIGAGGRGVLNEAERVLLAQQHRNRSTVGVLPGAAEERSRRGRATDASAKAPSFFRDSIGTAWHRPRAS
jgi:hypothetical protein